MRRVKLIISVCVLSLFCASTVLAQSERSPVSIEQVASPGIEKHTEAVKEFGVDFFFNNLAIHGQTDWIFDHISLEGNSATIKQYGVGNKAYLTQKGSSNIGYIQMGSQNNPVRGNEADVLQDGSQLISVINMQGSDNYLKFDQYGQSIGAYIQFEGSQLDITATQNLGPYGKSNFSFKTKQMQNPISVTSSSPVIPLIIESN